MAARSLMFAVALCAGIGDAAAEDSFRCPGGIVEKGDTKLDLLGKCGEPAYAEEGPTVEERIARRDPAAPVVVEDRVRWSVERWSYDLGPTLFTHHVEIAGGRVVSVARGDRGTAAAPRPAALVRARCEPAAIHLGDRAAEVLARCGEPSVRDEGRRVRVEYVERSPIDAERVTVSVRRDVWVFDFGPQRFTTIVLLEDGRVARLDRGGYGYAPEADAT